MLSSYIYFIFSDNEQCRFLLCRRYKSLSAHRNEKKVGFDPHSRDLRKLIIMILKLFLYYMKILAKTCFVNISGLLFQRFFLFCSYLSFLYIFVPR